MKIVKNMSMAFLVKAVSTIIGIVISIIVARALGADARGDLESIRAYTMLIVVLGSLSLPQVIKYFIAKEKGREREILTSALVSGVIIALIEMAILIPALGLLLRQSDADVIRSARFFTLFIPTTFLASYGMAAHLGKGRFKKWYSLIFAQVVLQLIGILFLLFIDRVTASSVAFMFLVTNTLWAGFCLTGNRFGLLNITSTIRQVLKAGFRFSIPTTAQSLAQECARIIGVWYLVAGELGCYAMAITLSNQLLLFTFPFGTVGFVAVAERNEKNQQMDMVLKLFRATQIVIVPVGGLLIFLMPFLVSSLLPYSFNATIIIAQLMTVAAAINAMAVTLDNGLRAMNSIKPGSAGSLIGLCVMLALSPQLVSLYGANGIGFAIIAGAMFRLAGMLFFVRANFLVPLREFWAFRMSVFREVISILKTSYTQDEVTRY